MPTPSSRNSCACSYISTSIPARCSVSAVAKPPIPPPTMIIFMELLKKFQGLRSTARHCDTPGGRDNGDHDHGDAKRIADYCCQMRDGHLGCTRADIPGTSWFFSYEFRKRRIGASPVPIGSDAQLSVLD